MMPPVSRFVVELARASGITTVTLRTWKKAARAEGRLMPANGANIDRWSSADKFRMVLETAPLSENELSEYCRRQGVFPEQIAQWRAACEEANQAGNKVQAKRIRELEGMLKRKDAKLIEAEALLALEKKLEAIWGKGKAG
jgi:transposase-like protein